MIDLSAPREVGIASDRLKPRVVASVVVPVVTILGEGRNPLILLPNRMRFVRRLSKRCPIRTTVVKRGCILDTSICNTNLTGEESLVYGNGTKYDGTWCEGSKVHGKTGKSKSGAFSSRGDTSKTSASGNSSHGGKESGARGRVPPRPPQQQMSQQPRPQSTTPPKQQSQRQQSQCLAPPKQQPQSPAPLAQPKQQLQKQQVEIATDMKEYRDLYTSTLLTVKNMKFIDFYGDPGRYTGEVNEKKMPHGMGVQTYDHGLVQEGKWTNGILDEGSVMSCHPKNSSGSVASSRKSPSTSWRGGGASSVASVRSRVKDP
eukprot:g7355.t1 g7355   contig24:423783-424819(-)